MTPLSYLMLARRRLRLLMTARGLAALAALVLALTAGAAWIIMSVVPASSIVVGLRVSLYLVLALCIALLVWWPSDRRRVARALEKRVPAFQGRMITWLDAARRGERGPLLALLGHETAVIAEAHPMERVIPARQLALPAAAALLATVLLGALLIGSHPWQLAAQRLWVGNLLEDAQPRILVAPGDLVVRRGSDVIVNAEAHGFLPGSMDVHAAFGASAWEQAPMSQHGDSRFGFVFVGISEEVEYYVSARGLASTRHRIRVADLPRVTGVEITRHFPEWTGLDPRRDRQGDLVALPGTRVEVAVSTDRPAGDAWLVVDGEAAGMALQGERLSGGFDVRRPGRWHVAVNHEGELARISDTFLIELAEDRPPEVAFTFPGHDRKATPIEEVVLGFETTDDYAVESLTLSYAVNGGDWNEVPLDLEMSEHLLALEALTVADGRTGERPLGPGDVISFYAEARDHSHTTRTALYFVDVRPYDMRYRESQQMAGQGGAEGGGFDIAERQRDILSATWNLINKRDELEPQALEDQANVLAMLQRTLRDQVETLVSRSKARGLGAEGEVSTFLSELGRALEHMEPAAVKLEDVALDEAIPSEQRALKHLVTAESSMRDVDVSLARADTRGTSGRSLGELIELEMDRERNRYEMPQQPTFGDGTEEPRDEQDWKRLEELAARQERLARSRGRDPESLPTRWEQARLRREIEEMRRELESRSASGGGARSGSLERTLAELTAAEQALEGEDGDPQAAEQASEALRRAANTLRESARGNLEERLSRAGRQVANMEADQDRVMEALDELQQSALDRARSGGRIGRSEYGMQTFGAVKRRMQEDLAKLRGELTDLSEALSGRDPDGARVLDRALRELDEARLDERLAASAEAFEIGQPLYVIGSESLVEQALGRLLRRVEQARDGFARSGKGKATDPLEEVRALRRELAGAQDGDGNLMQDEVARVARSLARLEPNADIRQDGPGVGATGPLRDLGIYHIRGTADENTEVLYRMTLERLDLLEATLERVDAPPVRAQDPRDTGQDSAAAARYFRDLSRRTREDG